jgi:hypothetical protein
MKISFSDIKVLVSHLTVAQAKKHLLIKISYQENVENYIDDFSPLNGLHRRIS